MFSGTKLKMAQVARNLVQSGTFMLPLIGGMVALSGFRSATYSLEHLQAGGPPIANTLLLAWLSGAVLGPSLLPWLPGDRLATKAVLAGLLGLLLFPASCFFLHLEPLDVLMALLVIPSITFFLMTKHIHPIPLAGVALAAGIWITARFT
jgi:hypothetical protein